MSAPVVLNGKEYISARDAARLTGYTSDYIGQLARSGKFASQLVGKSRYVDEEGLRAYVARAVNTSGRKKNNQSSISDGVSAERTAAQIKKHSTFTYTSDEGPLYPIVSKRSARTLSGVASSETPAPSPVSSSATSQRAALMQLPSGELMQKFTAIIVAVLLVFGTYGLLHRTRITSNVTTLVAHSRTELVASARIALASFASVFANRVDAGVARLVALFRSDDLLSGDSRISRETPTAPSRVRTGREGVVVVPSTGSDVGNEMMKQQVRDVFSDEVIVEPDATGRSGVITPIFRDREAEPFLYLLVPVSDS